jgi:hypothetical protein
MNQCRCHAIAIASLLLQISAVCLCGQTNQIIYSDSLQNGWVNFSWASNNTANTSPVHSGTNSISVTCGAYTGMYLENAGMDTSPYTNLSFWLDGGPAGGQVLTVVAIVGGNHTIFSM